MSSSTLKTTISLLLFFGFISLTTAQSDLEIVDDDSIVALNNTLLLEGGGTRVDSVPLSFTTCHQHSSIHPAP